MGGPVKGDVVVVLFPFSDLSNAKKRPALVVAAPGGDDIILCQITSRLVTDNYAIPVTENNFSSGSLRVESNVRPTRIFTADKRIVQYIAGHLNEDTMGKVIDRVTAIFRS